MSYAKMMNWHKHHPKGTHQTCIMSTGSEFWPSHAFMEDDYGPYTEACKAANVEPLGAEEYYNRTLRGQMMSDQTMAARVQRTQYYNSVKAGAA